MMDVGAKFDLKPLIEGTDWILLFPAENHKKIQQLFSNLVHYR